MIRRLSLFLLGLFACQPGLPDSFPPEPLAPRPTSAEQTCEQIASLSPSASWHELGTLPSGPLLLSDPSVLGGPFEAPLRVSFKTPPSVRLLTNTSGTSLKALCLQLRSEGTTQTKRQELGKVGIDTGMLFLGEEAPIKKYLNPAIAQVIPCAEAPAEELEKLQKHLGTSGEQLLPLLPTLICAERPAVPEDQPRIDSALRAVHSEGRFLLEPRNPAWMLLQALHSQPWTAIPDKTQPTGFVVDVQSPDGAYPVFAETSEAQVVLLEIPLL